MEEGDRRLELSWRIEAAMIPRPRGAETMHDFGSGVRGSGVGRRPCDLNGEHPRRLVSEDPGSRSGRRLPERRLRGSACGSVRPSERPGARSARRRSGRCRVRGVLRPRGDAGRRLPLPVPLDPSIGQQELGAAVLPVESGRLEVTRRHDGDVPVRPDEILLEVRSAHGIPLRPVDVGVAVDRRQWTPGHRDRVGEFRGEDPVERREVLLAHRADPLVLEAADLRRRFLGRGRRRLSV
jgi:hypothetical protein